MYLIAYAVKTVKKPAVITAITLLLMVISEDYIRNGVEHNLKDGEPVNRIER